jgi:hypothetical protein
MTIWASLEQKIINSAMYKYDVPELIDDLEAEVIARSYSESKNSALYKLAYTGAIDNANGQLGLELEHAESLAGKLPIYDERKAIWSLKAYIKHHGTRGPQNGWGV